MKIRLRARKGWKYRLILCDDQGNCVYDDFGSTDQLHQGIHHLINDLVDKWAKEGGEKKCKNSIGV